jgi:hypothetical protein
MARAKAVLISSCPKIEGAILLIILERLENVKIRVDEYVDQPLELEFVFRHPPSIEE